MSGCHVWKTIFSYFFTKACHLAWFPKNDFRNDVSKNHIPKSTGWSCGLHCFHRYQLEVWHWCRSAGRQNWWRHLAHANQFRSFKIHLICFIFFRSRVACIFTLFVIINGHRKTCHAWSRTLHAHTMHRTYASLHIEWPNSNVQVSTGFVRDRLCERVLARRI